MFSSPGDNRAEPCEHTTALHPDALTFLSVMSEIWGASYTLAVICFSCVGVSGSLPVCASTPVFFLSHPHLLIPFLHIVEPDVICLLQLVYETQNRGGRREHRWLHFPPSSSPFQNAYLSGSILLFLSLSFFLSILLVSPLPFLSLFFFFFCFFFCFVFLP